MAAKLPYRAQPAAEDGGQKYAGTYDLPCTLKMDTLDDSFINNDFMYTLSQSSDRRIYNWIKNNLS